MTPQDAGLGIKEGDFAGIVGNQSRQRFQDHIQRGFQVEALADQMSHPLDGFQFLHLMSARLIHPFVAPHPGNRELRQSHSGANAFQVGLGKRRLSYQNEPAIPRFDRHRDAQRGMGHQRGRGPALRFLWMVELP